MAIHRQQVKEKSFSKLLKWVKNAENEAKMGSELFQLVRKCDWFDVVCAIRDASVHMGSDTVVFPINNKIAFKSVEETLKGVVKRRLPKQIMIKAEVVDFKCMQVYTLDACLPIWRLGQRGLSQMLDNSLKVTSN